MNDTTRRLTLCSTLALLAPMACTASTEAPDALLLDDQADGHDDTRPAAPHVPLTDAVGGAKQTPGFDLAISKSGDDIVLDWDEQDGNGNYRVFTSADPYFELGDPGVTMLQLVQGQTEYVHAGGNDDVVRYYRVRAMFASELMSTTVGKLVHTMEPGYTKLGLCLISEVDTTAELIADLESNAQTTYMWDESGQEWTWSWVHDPAPGLSFGVGQVVSVSHDDWQPVVPSLYTMVGHVPVEEDVSIELLPGDNLVTLMPLRFGDIMASELLGMVDHSQRIGYWDAATQTTTWYPDDGDFLLPTCSPVHVEVTASSTWPPPLPPPTSCLALLQDDPTAPSGDYELDLDGSGPLPPVTTYCDMDTDGGGFTELTIDLACTLGAQMVAEQAAPTADFDAQCRPFTQDDDGRHSYHYTVPFPPGFDQFMPVDYVARDHAPNGGSNDLRPNFFTQSTWGVAGGSNHGDVSFGAAEESGPTTSFVAEQTVDTIQCSGCELSFPGNGQVFTVPATSTGFRIGWGEHGSQAEGWYPWWSGSIRVR